LVNLFSCRLHDSEYRGQAVGIDRFENGYHCRQDHFHPQKAVFNRPFHKGLAAVRGHVDFSRAGYMRKVKHLCKLGRNLGRCPIGRFISAQDQVKGP